MKKFICALLLSIFLIPSVNAEERIFNYSNYNNEYYENYDEIYSKYKNIIDTMYLDLISYYNQEHMSNYPYYVMQIIFQSTTGYVSSINDATILRLGLKLYNEVPDLVCGSTDCFIAPTPSKEGVITYYDISTNNYTAPYTNNYSYGFQFYNNRFLPMRYYESNFDLINTSTYDIRITNYQDNDIIYSPGDIIPSLSTINNNKYKEVNLDNYEQVILSLKDYSKTEPFEVNLKVKGMIGITPVYEFGTTEKENVTDRCNISYEDFTDYRFFILKNDLINNAIYYVKGCESGSSFKYDSTIFDITYVTADNVNDPVITFGGNTYHVIPFNKLSTTANSNEENNFVPGASEEFEPGNYLSSFWNSLTTLMGLVTKFFNTLPIEIRAISITAFFTAITLGVIKFIKS